MSQIINSTAELKRGWLSADGARINFGKHSSSGLSIDERAYDRHYMPYLTFGETYYIPYYDALCQCRLDAIAYDREERCYTIRMRVAHNGTTETCSFATSYNTQKFYKSVADYKNKIAVESFLIAPIEIFFAITHLNCNYGDYYGSGGSHYYTAYRWEWNGFQSVKRIPQFLTHFINGFEITSTALCVKSENGSLTPETQELSYLLHSTYPCKEECEEENEINVCEFDADADNNEDDFVSLNIHKKDMDILVGLGIVVF